LIVDGKLKVAIIGTGSMANTYSRVFDLSGSRFLLSCIIGRKARLPDWQKDSFSDIPYYEGVANFLSLDQMDMVVVAVSESSILEVVLSLTSFRGLILLEKPVGRNLNEFHQITEIAKEFHLNVRVALNRRHYETVEFTRSMEGSGSFLVQDQQGTSEFSSNRLEAIGRENIPYANSIHLIDAALYIAGAVSYKILEPIIVSGPGLYTGRVLINESQVMTYVLAWEVPGPWSISCFYEKHHCDLRPIEKLVVKDSDRNIYLELEESGTFKPGMRNMLDEAAQLISQGKSRLARLENCFLSASLTSELITIGN
jgi:hypothetical protein|tara:strand:- start:407 stop:1342 length:936 start_codon:yes stop_codon:yes gene_type:complete